MKRSRHWLCTTIAAVSLLLCLSTAVLWVQSLWLDDDIRMELDTPGHYGGYLDVGACNGLGFICLKKWVGKKITDVSLVFIEAQPPLPQTAKTSPLIVDLLRDVRRFCGFGLHADRSLGWLAEYDAVIPLWFLTGIFAIPPARRIFKRLHHPPTRGFCSICGYDLRATPERCPECGKVVGKIIWF